MQNIPYMDCKVWDTVDSLYFVREQLNPLTSSDHSLVRPRGWKRIPLQWVRLWLVGQDLTEVGLSVGPKTYCISTINIDLFHPLLNMFISFCVKKTRWNPRTRMPTRMLRNKDDTYFSHFPANPLVRHPELTHWGDTLVRHPWLTLLRNALVRHSCLTLLLDTLVGHSYLTLLTWHSYLTLVWDTLTWHSSKTLLLDTLVRHFLLDTLTWHFLLDTLTWHSYLTLLTWHSCLTRLLRHSYLTLLLDTCVGHSYLTLF